MSAVPALALAPTPPERPPTDEQAARILLLVRNFNAPRWECHRGGALDGLAATWIYLVLYPERGGPVHIGIAPDGSSHS